MVKRFSRRVPKPFNGKRADFTTDRVGKTGYPHRKEVAPLPYTIYKN